jgi:hypothetical protein
MTPEQVAEAARLLALQSKLKNARGRNLVLQVRLDGYWSTLEIPLKRLQSVLDEELRCVETQLRALGVDVL